MINKNVLKGNIKSVLSGALFYLYHFQRVKSDTTYNTIYLFIFLASLSYTILSLYRIFIEDEQTKNISKIFYFHSKFRDLD